MTDIHREDERLPGTSTLDIWEPWWSGKVGSGQINWPLLLGGQSANILAPLQGLAKDRDSSGEERRLPGIC